MELLAASDKFVKAQSRGDAHGFLGGVLPTDFQLTVPNLHLTVRP